MMLFRVLTLFVCVGLQSSSGKYADYLKNQEVVEFDESFLEEFHFYEKLYNDFVIKYISGNAGTLHTTNVTFNDETGRYKLSDPRELRPYFGPNINTIYGPYYRGSGYNIRSHHNSDGSTHETNPTNNNNQHFNGGGSPVVNVENDWDSDHYTSSSDNYSDLESSSSSGSEDNSSAYLSASNETSSELPSDSDEDSDSVEISNSDEEFLDETSDSQENSFSEELSNSERETTSYTTENSRTNSSEYQSDESSVSSQFADAEAESDYNCQKCSRPNCADHCSNLYSSSDSVNSNGDEDESEETETASSSQEPDDSEDFYFDYPETENTHKNISRRSLNDIPVTPIRIAKSHGITTEYSLREENLSIANETAPKLRILNLNSNSTLPNISIPPSKNIMQLLDEKINSLVLGSEEHFRSADQVPDETPEDISEHFKGIRHALHYDTPVTSEEIELKEISWNDKFSSDRLVSQWASLNNKAAGFFQNQLTLVTASHDGFHVSHQEVGGIVSDLHVLQLWDEEERSLLDVLVTAEDARVNWYHFSGDEQLEQLWSWEQQEPVCRVRVRMTERGLKALLTFQPNIAGDQRYDSYTGVYGVAPWSSWWLEQKLPGGGAGAAVSEDASFLALAQPDGDSVHFYTYDPRQSKYILSEVIQSPGVRCVSAFSSGEDSFLAVGAARSALYLAKGSALTETSVLDYHLEAVDVFLPVKVDYLRNAVILLIQYSLDHGTHSSTLLEALTWSGRRFQLLPHAPCLTGSPHSAHGLACLLEAEGLDGIRGAAPLALPHSASLLLAGEDHPPLLFNLHTQVVSLPDPKDTRAQNILHTIKLLYEKFKTQNRALEEMKSKLLAPRRLVGRRWKIHQLRTPAIRLDGDLADVGSLVVGGKTWLKPASFHAGDYHRLVNFNNKRIKLIVKSLSDAVKLSDYPQNLSVPIVFNRGITVHGNVFADDAHIKTINDVPIYDVLRHSRTLGADHKLHVTHRHFPSLTVKKLFVSGAINGIHIFQQTHARQPLIINSNVEIFDKILNITEDIILCDGCLLNNIDVVQDTVRTDAEVPGTLEFRELEVTNKFIIKQTINNMVPTAEALSKIRSQEHMSTSLSFYDSATIKSLTVGGNLNVTQVNGRNWETFENGFIFKNVPNYLDNINIKGNVIAKSGVYINKLNSLIFPNEYVSMYETGPVVVTGLKSFKNTVHTKRIKCSGSMNNIKPEDMITLSSEQALGNFSFTKLRVNELLAIKGDILGTNLEDIFANPTLSESKKIASNVIFKNIFVNGLITVQNKFNNTYIHDLKSQIFVNNQDVMIVESVKEFGDTVNIQNGLFVNSNKVSQVSLAELLTTDITKNSQADVTLGHVTIHQISLNGSFAHTNFTDILRDAIYADGKKSRQEIHGHIHFYNSEQIETYDEIEDFHQSLQINNLIVLNKVNEFDVTGNIFKKNDKVVHIKTNNVNFRNLKTKNIHVHGSIETNNMIAGVDLKEFDSTRLSRTRDQVITGNYIIQNCTSYGNIVSEFLNTYPTRDILIAYNKLLSLKDDIFAGRVPIDHLKVGSLVSNGINGKYLKEIAKKAIYLNKENSIFSNFTFLDPIEVSHLDVTGYIYNEYLPNFVKDVVFADEESIVINGRLEYTTPLKVTKTLSSKYLNNIDVDVDLLQKNRITNVRQPVRVLGDVIIKSNLNVSGFYNNEYITDFNVKIYDDEIIIQGNVYFDDGQIINKLNLNGLINNKHNLNNILNTLVWLNESQTTKIDVTFTNPIVMMSGVNIRHLYNGVHFQNLLDELVYINSNMHLKGITRFSEPIIFQGNLIIKDELSTECLNNFSLRDWKYNAIFKDKDEVLIGRQIFKKLTSKGNINANSLNELALQSIFTSNMDQTLPNDIYVDNLVINDEMIVNGLVNELNIKDIYAITFMKYGTQLIKAPIIFQSEVFVNNVTNIKFINEKPIENIVPLSTAQDLYGTYSFVGKTNAHNVEFSGALNNINFNDWMSRAIFGDDSGDLKITGNVIVNDTLYVDQLDTTNILLNGENLTALSELLDRANKSFIVFNDYLEDKCKTIQDEIRFLKEKINQRYYKHFKKFEEIQVIKNSINTSIHSYIETNSKQLILLNIKDLCVTQVWQWSPRAAKFEHWLTVDTGEVKHWHSFLRGGETYLVSDVMSNNCTKSKSSIWKLTNDSMKLISTLEPLQKLLSVDNGGAMSLRDASTGQIKGYHLKNVNGIVSLKEDKNYVLTDSFNNETAVKFLIGRFLQISVGVFSSKLEVHSHNGLHNTIEASNPKNVHILELNEFQNILIFTDSSKMIQVYEYQGMRGYVYSCTVAVEADRVKSTFLHNELGERVAHLLVDTSDSFTLLAAVMNNDG